MYWRLPPRSGSFLRRWYLLCSIFGAGFTTFGIRAWDSRVSLLQTGHHLIFRNKKFSTKVEKLKCLGYEAQILRNIITKFQSLVQKIFRHMVCGIYGFLQAPKFNLNRSSWNFRNKIFSTKFQKLKFLGCEAKILRKIVAKFHNLVRKICVDMVCGN